MCLSDIEADNIEIINKKADNRIFKAALFDFDGTLSLIREGWQEVMVPYFFEEFRYSLPDSALSDNEIISIITEFVDRLTGKQTIFQCMALKDEIVTRGGVAKEPMEYKNEYLRRLFLKIESRRNSLCNKTAEPADYMVSGAEDILVELKKNGIDIYCASGTDQPQVREEASFLQLDKYFGENIYGALDEKSDQCSKEVVINRLLNEKSINGNELLVFGDGFVEIELVKNVGGYAIALATDEKNKAGIDEAKRKRLISAGADIVIPDFSNASALIRYLINNN